MMDCGSHIHDHYLPAQETQLSGWGAYPSCSSHHCCKNLVEQALTFYTRLMLLGAVEDLTGTLS